MPGGRKSKYTPETVQLIVDAIEETGKDVEGCKAACITENTFYRWLKEKSEFSQLITSAKATFRANRPQSLRSEAVKRLAEYIKGEAIEVYDKTTATKDAKGNLISTTKSVTKIKRGCPQWAIDRVLGKSMPVLEAVQVLLNEGIASPSMAAVVESSIDEMQRRLRDLNESDMERAKLEALVGDGAGDA
jgi:transposase-like protein